MRAMQQLRTDVAEDRLQLDQGAEGTAWLHNVDCAKRRLQCSHFTVVLKYGTAICNDCHNTYVGEL